MGAGVVLLSVGAWVFSILRAGMIRHVSASGALQPSQVSGSAEVVILVRMGLLSDHGLEIAAGRHVFDGETANEFRADWQSQDRWQFELFQGRIRSTPWNSLQQGHWRVLGAGVTSMDNRAERRWVATIHVPCWLPTALGVLPIVWYLLPANRRARRRAAGMCEKCSYSRAGMADEAPCPECGTIARPIMDHAHP